MQEEGNQKSDVRNQRSEVGSQKELSGRSFIEDGIRLQEFVGEGIKLKDCSREMALVEEK